MSRVLITGATGFLGGRLAIYLRERGYQILALGRSANRCHQLKTQGFDVLRHDLSSRMPETMVALLEDVDTIVHCAALAAPFGRLSAFTSANVDATQNMVTLARSLGVRRFVNISSACVYFALRDQMNVSEDSPLPPAINHYARTKKTAEDIVLAAPDIGPINLRFRGIYGVGDQNLLPRLLRVARSRALPLLRGGVARTNLIHESDACSAIEAAIKADRSNEGETFNISGGEFLLIREIVERTCLRAGLKVRWRPVPFFVARMAARVNETVYAALPHCPEPPITSYLVCILAFELDLNISKAQRQLDWRPVVRF